jgi:methyl-accepting chemotaxis protein
MARSDSQTVNEIAESTRRIADIANSMRETVIMTRKLIIESRDLIDQIAGQLQK